MNIMTANDSKVLRRERVFVVIDGSNFYNKLHDGEVGATNLLKFDYSGFVAWLVGNGRTISDKIYYVGVVRVEVNNPKSEDMRRNQQRLFSHLGSTGWKVERGFLMKTGDRYHEKGVDVKIAVDLVVGAYKDDFDTVILLSSDTDLLPALHEVKARGKKIEYVGFSHSPSLALVRNANSSRLLVRSDIEPFVFSSPIKILPSI